MSKNDIDKDDDFALFQDAVQGVKKLRQDTIIQQPKKILNKKKSNAQTVKRVILSFTFLMSLFRFLMKRDQLVMHVTMCPLMK